MKRKTNLFYTSGEDSKFLTFSNYTEALTGNFLSTNIKLFPNAFLCLNIPSLTDKGEFIRETLVGYYENKLAVLRDAGHITDVDELRTLLNCIGTNYPDMELVFKGDITEQDYNGTFTDLICTIDSSRLHVLDYTCTNTETSENLVLDETPNKLHGWYNGETYVGPTKVDENGNIINLYDLTIKYDIVDGENNYYTYGDTIEITNKIDEFESSITFNIIIPLFNVVNIELSTTPIKENSPLGIWFADRTIELTMDGLYGQTWSLAIGSQFKPIPTMQNNYSDVSGNESSAVAYNTFAQVLSRQNGLLESYEKLWIVINNLTKRIQDLEKQIDTNN